jgi:hypothetical protein
MPTIAAAKRVVFQPEWSSISLKYSFFGLIWHALLISNPIYLSTQSSVLCFDTRNLTPETLDVPRDPQSEMRDSGIIFRRDLQQFFFNRLGNIEGVDKFGDYFGVDGFMRAG